MSVFNSRLNKVTLFFYFLLKIINTNYTQNTSPKRNYTESSQIVAFNKSKVGIPHDLFGRSAKGTLKFKLIH